MKQLGVILLLSWMLMRLAFHMFVFNAEVTRFVYFGGNDVALIGLFLLLMNNVRGILQRIIKVCLIYAGFCLLADILMLIGIGAHDYWLYTAVSISILSIGILWAKYV